MSADSVSVPLLYFGKLPSRGDFVRSAQQPALIQTFDRWLSGALEILAVDARWKELYDAAAPLHFAVLGPRQRLVVAGHLRPSSDASGRRFPFLVAGSFEVADPRRFMRRAPLALAPLWRQAQTMSEAAAQSPDAGALLAEWGAPKAEVSTSLSSLEAAALDFAEVQTVSSLQGLLSRSHEPLDVQNTVLGLGLLLQPVPASGVSKLDKGVLLPLPADSLYAPLVASWWLSLLSRFLQRANFEVLLLLPQSPNAAPLLAVGFAGGSATALASHFGRLHEDGNFVPLMDPDWAQDSAQQDYAIKKLASYLRQQGLSLRQIARTFREAFLGE